MASQISQSRDVISIIEEILRQNGVDRIHFRAYYPNAGTDEYSIASDSLAEYKKIYEKVKEENPNYLIALESKVYINDKPLHIPMIDFSNSKINNLDIPRVKKILEELGEDGGYILDSGRCFHYYGKHLIDESEWLDFITSCIPYDEIGEKYINHQLKRGSCCLRIVANDKKPKVPTLLEVYKKPLRKIES